MVDERKYPEYREKLYEYIINTILPKYEELESCIFHVFPQYMDKDVELIFKINSNFKDLKELSWDLELEISTFCENFLEFDYRNKYMILFIMI